MNSNEIIFVTTFNNKIYETSGCKLLESYVKFVKQTDNIKFNVFTEGNIDINIDRSDLIIKRMEDSEYLQSWLNKNSHIIPTKFGGTFKGYLSYYNTKASRFFRKLAALYETLKYNANADMIIWLDADIEILSSIDQTFLLNMFSHEAECYYLYGQHRKNSNSRKNIHHRLGIETGLLVFKKNFNILNEWFNIYDNDFIQYKRWDDGWIFKYVLKQTKYKSIDIGGNCDNPLQESKLKDIFIHHKGIHKKLDKFYTD